MSGGRPTRLDWVRSSGPVCGRRSKAKKERSLRCGALPACLLSSPLPPLAHRPTGGELFDRIPLGCGATEETARRYFRQLLSGVGYCHARGVCHRDIKPENLLLDEHANLKVGPIGPHVTSSPPRLAPWLAGWLAGWLVRWLACAALRHALTRLSSLSLPTPITRSRISASRRPSPSRRAAAGT